MRLRGGRTGKRAVICEDLGLTGLMQPFSLEARFGDRIAVLGSNGSGKSHFLRLLAAGGPAPDPGHRPVPALPVAPSAPPGRAGPGPRGRPGGSAQTPGRAAPRGRPRLGA